MNESQIRELTDAGVSHVNIETLKNIDYNQMIQELNAMVWNHDGKTVPYIEFRENWQAKFQPNHNLFVTDCRLWLQGHAKEIMKPKPQSPLIEALKSTVGIIQSGKTVNPKPSEFAWIFSQYHNFARIKNTKDKDLLIEKNRVYVMEGDSFVREQIEEAWPDSNTSFKNEVISKIGDSHQCDRSEFDQDKMILNCQNCFVDLRTGQKVDLPDYKSLIQIPAEHRPELNETELWLDSLHKATGDNWNIALEYLACGLSRGAINPEKALILIGDGGNGKSTLLLPLITLYGTNNITNKSLYDLTDKHEAVMLEGKYANIGTEMPDGMMIKYWNLIKAIISHEPISARDLYHSSRDITMTAQLIFSLNELTDRPRISDSVDRRFIIIECKNRFSNDDDFKKSLQSPEEASRILNTLVRVHKEILDNGKKMRYTQEEEITKKLWTEHDTVDMFIQERIRPNDGTGNGIEEPTIQQAYQAYLLFAHERNRPHIKLIPFNKRLKEYGYENSPRKGRRVWIDMMLITHELKQTVL